MAKKKLTWEEWADQLCSKKLTDEEKEFNAMVRKERELYGVQGD